MLVLAMEFSRGTAALARRRSLATEKEQLGWLVCLVRAGVPGPSSRSTRTGASPPSFDGWEPAQVGSGLEGIQLASEFRTAPSSQ